METEIEFGPEEQYIECTFTANDLKLIVRALEYYKSVNTCLKHQVPDPSMREYYAQVSETYEELINVIKN